jgi:hypothetical protein
LDVIGAHASRLPALDERWEPRPYPREELAEALVAGGVAGPAGHPHHNVFGNIRMLVEHDPDKLFGLSDLPEPFGFEDIVRLVGEASGVPIDALATEGSPDIHPGAVLDACAAVGERLAAARGARIVRPAEGLTWSDVVAAHGWTVAYHGAVGMVTDGERPRHTHRPDPMERMLEGERPDLVLADHGFAGAAIQAGVETLSIADVNDPALIVAKAQGRTEVVVVLDDHVPPEAYWPCFQAVAAQLS